MHESVTILPRFCGPPNSGNGGYVCGLLGRGRPGATEVTLMQPPPINVEMQILADDEDTLLLKSGDDVIASARPAALDLSIPEPPTFEQALAVQNDFAGFNKHSFPGCFVCGPARAEADGLRVFAAPLHNSGLVAAAWLPDGSLAGEDGVLREEFLWAALDCPGYFAFRFDDQAALLGRMTASIQSAPKAGDPCVVVGWEIARQGRKHVSGTALFGADGLLCGQALATWITI